MNPFILAILTLMTNPSKERVEEATEKHQFVSLKTGATAQEVLLAYGTPDSIDDLRNLYTRKSSHQFHYHSDLCVYLMGCSVTIEDNKVIAMNGIKPKYMGY